MLSTLLLLDLWGPVDRGGRAKIYENLHLSAGDRPVSGSPRGLPAFMDVLQDFINVC